MKAIQEFRNALLNSNVSRELSAALDDFMLKAVSDAVNEEALAIAQMADDEADDLWGYGTQVFKDVSRPRDTAVASYLRVFAARIRRRIEAPGEVHRQELARKLS